MQCIQDSRLHLSFGSLNKGAWPTFIYFLWNCSSLKGGQQSSACILATSLCFWRCTKLLPLKCKCLIFIHPTTTPHTHHCNYGDSLIRSNLYDLAPRAHACGRGQEMGTRVCALKEAMAQKMGGGDDLRWWVAGGNRHKKAWQVWAWGKWEGFRNSAQGEKQNKCDYINESDGWWVTMVRECCENRVYRYLYQILCRYPHHRDFCSVAEDSVAETGRLHDKIPEPVLQVAGSKLIICRLMLLLRPLIPSSRVIWLLADSVLCKFTLICMCAPWTARWICNNRISPRE